ncbi:hypothetical protein GCM10027605_70960 [Micromonospora zhanjiangensis]
MLVQSAAHTAIASTINAVRPPRLNCVGYCQHCGEHGCSSTACVTAWEAARWMPCDRCGGHGYDPVTIRPCACYLGVVQVDTTEVVAAPAGSR